MILTSSTFSVTRVLRMDCKDSVYSMFRGSAETFTCVDHDLELEFSEEFRAAGACTRTDSFARFLPEYKSPNV